MISRSGAAACIPTTSSARSRRFALSSSSHGATTSSSCACTIATALIAGSWRKPRCACRTARPSRCWGRTWTSRAASRWRRRCATARRAIASSRDDLEQRVSRAHGRVARRLQELESFAYAVSHDLKAPLRAMDGFSHLLLESSRGKLDPAEQSYLQRIRRGALQMDALIDGLLAYSRMERREMHAAPSICRPWSSSLLAEREEEIAGARRGSARAGPAVHRSASIAKASAWSCAI